MFIKISTKINHLIIINLGERKSITRSEEKKKQLELRSAVTSINFL